MAWYPANGLDYNDGVDCQRENEWCHYQEAHEHGGFACDPTCPCRADLAGYVGPRGGSE